MGLTLSTENTVIQIHSRKASNLKS